MVIEVDIQIAAESKLLWYLDKLQREESLTQLYRPMLLKRQMLFFS